MKLSKAILGALGAITIAGASAAHAAMINGTVGFTSSPNTPAGTATQSGGVTTIHFNNPLFVNFGTDDYSGTSGQPVHFTDFSFTGTGTSASLGSSIVPEWTFSIGSTTYSFDLQNLVSGTFTPGRVSALSLQGEGIAHITGFDDTEASFSLQGTGNHFTFTILQASTTAVGNAVPDGGSAMTLLGLGLVAVEVVRRKLAAS
jgi:hypothetical protein